MEAFVLDVSACMPWCCEDEATPASERMLSWAIDGSHLHVPSLWPWEMMNAVAIAVRRGRIMADRAAQFFAQIATFNFRIVPAPVIVDFARLSLLASRHRLTAYMTRPISTWPNGSPYRLPRSMTTSETAQSPKG